MGLERIWSVTQAPGEVSNPTAQFQPTQGVAIDEQIPDTGTTRVVRVAGEIWTSGPTMAQLEVYLGGAGNGATWGRINVELPSAGWSQVAGSFEHSNVIDPERLIVRCRSYEAGADAKLRNCRVDAIDVQGVTYGSSWLPDTGVGEETPTTEIVSAGETRTVRTLGMSGIPAGTYRVAVSAEIGPNGANPATLELVGDGHALASWQVQGYGLTDRMIGISPMLVYPVDAGSRTWELRVRADSEAPTRVRRAGLFVVNWDEVTA